MSIEFDEKGKYFTDIITKEAIKAVIQTTKHLIRGYIHVRQDARLKDELDLEESFIAVTDAQVISTDNQVLYQAEFMAIHRNHIVWVITESDLAEKGENS